MITGRILVAGAINTDLVATVDRAPEAGETITGQSFAIYSGGKGANQAVAAARSGARVSMLGGVGDDGFGAARRTDLTGDDIDDTWIATVAGTPSGVALITVETSGENRIAYIPGATLEVSPDHCVQALNTVKPDLILAANELTPACHRQLFRTAKERGVRVVFNAAPDPHRARDILSLIDVLIVNRGEAAAMAGIEPGDNRPAYLVDRLRDAGSREVVITLGADGACGWTDGRYFLQPAPVVEAVDTTGAGDAFCGAVAARLLAGDSLVEAVRYGVVAGALSATRPGAQSSIPFAGEIDHALQSLGHGIVSG